MVRVRAVVKWAGLALILLVSVGYYATQVAEFGAGWVATLIDAVGMCLLYLLAGYLIVLLPMDLIIRRRRRQQQLDTEGQST